MKDFTLALLLFSLFWFAFILAIAIPGGIETLGSGYLGGMVVFIIINIIIAARVVDSTPEKLQGKIIYSAVALIASTSMFFFLSVLYKIELMLA